MMLIMLEKITKPSLKSLDSTNPHSDRLCTNDHCYLPEKCSTNKDHSKAERVIVCEVEQVPRVTSKQLKAFLTLINDNVHEPSIRRTPSNGRKPLISKMKMACQRSGGLDYWREV